MERLPEMEGLPETLAQVVGDFHRLYYDRAKLTWKRTFWRGVPIQKFPQDLVIYQEIIHEVRPDVVVETGTLHGGSALFFADMLHLVHADDNYRVVTVDVAPQVDWTHPRITFLRGNSVSKEVIDAVEAVLGEFYLPTVMVVLDSDHDPNHVLQELYVYAGYVSVGSYLIVEDTNLSGNPVPEYGLGDPAKAVREFLALNDDFVVDRYRERLLLTANPGGFLKKVRR